MNFELSRFHREKSLQFTLITYPAFTVAGFILVKLSQGSHNAIVIAAMLFMVGPLAAIYLYRSRFVRPVRIFITDDLFRIEEDGFSTVTVNWHDVKSYQAEFTRSLLGSGYNLKFVLNDGSKRHFILYEPSFTGTEISKDSALHQVCISVGHYNRGQGIEGQAIELRPNLFSLKPASILISILGILLIADLIIRLSNHQGSRQVNIGGSLMIAIVMAVSVFGRKKTDDAAYSQMKALQDNQPMYNQERE